MPEFEEYLDLIRSQLFFMQPVQTPDAVQLDQGWLRTRYDEISKLPIAHRPNELVVAQEWESERQAREKANADAARA